MDRAAIGLGSVFMHLKAEINWYQLFHELIDDFNETALAARQRAALAAAGVPLPPHLKRPASRSIRMTSGRFELARSYTPLPSTRMPRR